jgi:NTE family protein
MANMDSISTVIFRRSDNELLERKRAAFRSSFRPVLIDDLVVEGVNSKQRAYVRAVVKRDSSVVPLESLRNSYFRIVSDKNVRHMDPWLVFDSTDGTFDLHLKVTRERDLITRFGGNISSRPVSEAYGGLTYLVWGRRAYSFSSDFYFGRLYTSGRAKIRMEAPTRLPYYLELDATMNQYDFFRSINAFFPEQKPSYILKSDYHFGVTAGIPSGNKSKFYGSGGYVRLADNYYQTPSFSMADTADKTTLKGVTAQLSYEWNTLNKKQFANEGAFLQWRARICNLDEKTVPGSTSADRTIITDRHFWLQLSLKYDKYFFERRLLKLGFNLQAVASNMPFFNNFTVTSVNSPAFEPITEMKTLFLPAYRAQNFLGGGIRNILSLRSNLDLRLEGYVFQPYKELLEKSNNDVENGTAFNKRYFIGSSSLVFHSPIGPVSMQVNYYERQKNPVSVLFTAGFLLFHPGALD